MDKHGPYYNSCYMAVTADKYELPVAVFDDIHALARWAGTSEGTARTTITRKSVRGKGAGKGCRFVAVKEETE